MYYGLDGKPVGEVNFAGKLGGKLVTICGNVQIKIVIMNKVGEDAELGTSQNVAETDASKVGEYIVIVESMRIGCYLIEYLYSVVI